jgi:hypothetical protein
MTGTVSAMSAEAMSSCWGGHGADAQGISLPLDAFELGDGGNVDQVFGGREPQLHHRDQALTAGQDARAIGMLGQQPGGLGNGLGAMIGE